MQAQVSEPDAHLWTPGLDRMDGLLGVPAHGPEASDDGQAALPAAVGRLLLHPDDPEVCRPA